MLISGIPGTAHRHKHVDLISSAWTRGQITALTAGHICRSHCSVSSPWQRRVIGPRAISCRACYHQLTKTYIMDPLKQRSHLRRRTSSTALDGVSENAISLSCCCTPGISCVIHVQTRSSRICKCCGRILHSFSATTVLPVAPHTEYIVINTDYLRLRLWNSLENEPQIKLDNISDKIIRPHCGDRQVERRTDKVQYTSPPSVGGSPNMS